MEKVKDRMKAAGVLMAEGEARSSTSALQRDVDDSCAIWKGQQQQTKYMSQGESQGFAKNT